MVVVNVCSLFACFANRFLYSLTCLGDLGKVSGSRRRGRLLSLLVSIRGYADAWPLTQSVRSRGGMLGLKLGLSVTLKVSIGEGSVSLVLIAPGVAPSEGAWVFSSVGALRRHHLPLQRGNCGVISPT